MTDKAPDQTAAQPRQNVLVRARNGDVIRYDDSGLILRLSDRVIADIALRLGTAPQPAEGPGPAGPVTVPHHPPSTAGTPEDSRLEKLDVWDVVQSGDWLLFNGRLPGKQGVRRYRLAANGGHVLADAPGPLFAILGIGGARAALADHRPCEFPQHILAPADDIGAVGHAGVEHACDTALLEHLHEMTHEALAAEAFLNWQLDKHQAMPLFVTRVETDESADAGALSQGTACDNLIIAAANVQRAAGSMGKKAKLLAITLDYALEDTSGSALGYRDGVLSLMGRIEAGLTGLGFPRPVFVTRFEHGSDALPDHHAIEGQWELVWNHGDHRLLFSAPGYMFAHDDTDRPTPDARRQMAEMTAAAASDPEGWQCPLFHLAETVPSPEGAQIRLVAQAGSGLTLTTGDAACAKRPVGLRLIGDDTGARITDVAIDPADPKTLLVSLDRMPAGADLRLAYAIGKAATDADADQDASQDAGRIAIHDDWSLPSATGITLRRWALPCLLPIHQGEDHART